MFPPARLFFPLFSFCIGAAFATSAPEEGGGRRFLNAARQRAHKEQDCLRDDLSTSSSATKSAESEQYDNLLQSTVEELFGKCSCVSRPASTAASSSETPPRPLSTTSSSRSGGTLGLGLPESQSLHGTPPLLAPPLEQLERLQTILSQSFEAADSEDVLVGSGQWGQSCPADVEVRYNDIDMSFFDPLSVSPSPPFPFVYGGAPSTTAAVDPILDRRGAAYSSAFPFVNAGSEGNSSELPIGADAPPFSAFPFVHDPPFVSAFPFVHSESVVVDDPILDHSRRTEVEVPLSVSPFPFVYGHGVPSATSVDDLLCWIEPQATCYPSACSDLIDPTSVPTVRIGPIVDTGVMPSPRIIRSARSGVGGGEVESVPVSVASVEAAQPQPQARRRDYTGVVKQWQNGARVFDREQHIAALNVHELQNHWRQIYYKNIVKEHDSVDTARLANDTELLSRLAEKKQTLQAHFTGLLQEETWRDNAHIAPIVVGVHAQRAIGAGRLYSHSRARVLRTSSTFVGFMVLFHLRGLYGQRAWSVPLPSSWVVWTACFSSSSTFVGCMDSVYAQCAVGTRR